MPTRARQSLGEVSSQAEPGTEVARQGGIYVNPLSGPSLQ
jgi:hypothetical protein